MGNFMRQMLNMVGFETEDDYRDEFEETEEFEEPVYDRINDRRSSRVVRIHNSNAQMRVVVIQPETFEESRDITNHLKSKKPIVVNLESVDNDVARRIIDFLSGAVYALDGDIQKVSNGIFIVVPNNIDIMSDIIREEKKTGFRWN